LIDDANSNVARACRSYEYYVDPLSEEVVELGTKLYPFKSPSLPFIEIFNYFSHKQVNVTIYLADNTLHKLKHEGNLVLDMDTIIIKPYSPTGATNVGRPNILIKGNINSIFSELTKFNIIKSDTLNSQLFELSDNVSDGDRQALISNDGWTLVIIKTNFSLYNATVKGTTIIY
jgi:hypothetical protein